MKTKIGSIKDIISRIDISCLGNKNFGIRVERDVKDKENGRIFIQIMYTAPCTKTGMNEIWRGRKFYLSDHMTEQEVIGTMFLAFKLAVEHEIMEGFKVDGKVLFNPHVSFEKLLEISEQEVTRT
jgi:hypothetical protein